MEPQIYDPDVTSYGTNSIPPIMSAQIELMTTTRILQPLRKTVLKRLQKLMQANDLKCWFPIYLCLFILLHSCSILTADENRQARKYGLEVNHQIPLLQILVFFLVDPLTRVFLQTRYLFDAFIEEMHIGAKTMIYYFHYCNKGSRPFARNWASKENLALAELNPEQAQFLEESSVLIKERRKCASCSEEAIAYFCTNLCSKKKSRNLKGFERTKISKMIGTSFRSCTTWIGNLNLLSDQSLI